MEDDLKKKNGRRPTKNKMEDDLKKIKMEDNLKKMKLEDNLLFLSFLKIECRPKNMEEEKNGR
jgi:hypothetical protein